MKAMIPRLLLLLLWIMVVAACSTEPIEEETPWMRVGDNPVYENEVMVYLGQTYSDFETHGGNDVWLIQDFDGGRSAEKVAVEAAKDNLVKVKLLVQRAKEMGILPDDDLQTQLEEEGSVYFLEMDEAFVQTHKINEALVQKVFLENYLADQVMAETISGYDNPGEDEVKAYLRANEDYARLAALSPEDVLTTYRLQIILLRTESTDEQGLVTKMDEEEVAKVRQEAQALYDQLEEGADFLSLVEAHSQLMYFENEPQGIMLSKTQLPEGYDTALETLTPGDYSEVLSVGSGFHIIRLEEISMPDANALKDYSDSFEAWEEALMEEARLEMAREAFEVIYTRWRTGASVEFLDQWESLDFLGLFNKMNP